MKSVVDSFDMTILLDGDEEMMNTKCSTHVIHVVNMCYRLWRGLLQECRGEICATSLRRWEGSRKSSKIAPVIALMIKICSVLLQDPSAKDQGRTMRSSSMFMTAPDSAVTAASDPGEMFLKCAHCL
jgi:hypothetical protein